MEKKIQRAKQVFLTPSVSKKSQIF